MYDNWYQHIENWSYWFFVSVLRIRSLAIHRLFLNGFKYIFYIFKYILCIRGSPIIQRYCSMLESDPVCPHGFTLGETSDSNPGTTKNILLCYSGSSSNIICYCFHPKTFFISFPQNLRVSLCAVRDDKEIDSALSKCPWQE